MVARCTGPGKPQIKPRACLRLEHHTSSVATGGKRNCVLIVCPVRDGSAPKGILSNSVGPRNRTTSNAYPRRRCPMSYPRFFAMIAVSTVVMFVLMYFNTYALEHVRFSETRVY